MSKFFKNQMNVFITLVSVMVLISLVWFFGIYNGLSATNEKLAGEVKSLQSKSNKATDLMEKLDGVKSEWSELNSSHPIGVNLHF